MLLLYSGLAQARPELFYFAIPENFPYYSSQHANFLAYYSQNYASILGSALVQTEIPPRQLAVSIALPLPLLRRPPALLYYGTSYYLK